MSSQVTDAAELRRQKILARGQERLNLLIGEFFLEVTECFSWRWLIDRSVAFKGVKNAEESIKEGKPVPEISPGEPDSLASLIKTPTPPSPVSALPSEVVKSQSPSIPSMLDQSGLRERKTKVHKTPIQFTPKSAKSNRFDAANSQCKSNGYSNQEIVIITFLALATSLLFNFDYSWVISNVSIDGHLILDHQMSSSISRFLLSLSPSW